ncbi:hypothetical protein L7F22_037352 [Adiantum nelumboides]|nr:hypothetical protein [Adiantum nelumboides]
MPSSLVEDKQDDQATDKFEAEEKKVDIAKPRPVGIELQVPLMQLEEPTQEEAYEEVRNFDYTKIILTLSGKLQCQKVVAKEMDFQKERAYQAYEEMENLRTALQLVTKERDNRVRENENLLKDLLDVHSQLDRKEAQCHELVKNEKKLKEQLKDEDSRFQKVNASYNTVKNTLIALLQNQEPASTVAATLDSATMNTLTALQEELQTKKIQRQLLVSGFMSQTAQHEAKVKQLEQDLAQEKAKLELQKQQNKSLNKEKDAVGFSSFNFSNQPSRDPHAHACAIDARRTSSRLVSSYKLQIVKFLVTDLVSFCRDSNSGFVTGSNFWFWFWFRSEHKYIGSASIYTGTYYSSTSGSGPSTGTQDSATQGPHIAASDSSSDFDVMEGDPMQQHLESSSQDMHALGQQLGISMFSRLKETLSRATRSEHATNEINKGSGEIDSPFTSQIDPVLPKSVHVSTLATTPIGFSKLTPSETLLLDGRSFAEVQEVERYILAAREKEIESLRKAEQR